MRAQNDSNNSSRSLAVGHRLHRPRGWRPGLAVVASVGAWALALTGAQVAYADPVTDSADVAELRRGIAALAEVALGDYENVGPLATALPLADTAPGVAVVRPGAAMQLKNTFDLGVKGALLTLAQQATTADFMAGVDGLDAEIAGTQVELTTANLVDSGDTRGFDLTIRASRTVDSPLAIVDPDGPGGEPLRLVTAEADPAPYELSFEFSGTVRTDPQGVRFWLDTTAGEPTVEFAAELASGDAFAFPGGAAAIGVGDVEILDDSTVDVSAVWSGTIDDVNGDGRLAMFEPPAFEGGEETPGELTVPADQLTTFDLAGSATADIRFGSDLLGLSSSPAPSLTMDADLAQVPEPLAELVASDGDLAAFEAFTRLGPVDLVSGIVQYGTLLRALQRHENVDAALPLASGTLSELYDLGGEFAKLAEDLIDVQPDPDPDPADPQPVIDVGISTVGDLADRIESDIPGAPAVITPVYDRDDAEVRLDFTIHTALDGDADVPPVLDDQPVDDTPPPGQTAFGDQLLDDTGLRGVAASGDPVVVETDVAIDIDLPMLIDLGEAAPAPDKGATAVVEFESPMVYERFGTELIDGAELRITEVASAVVHGEGQLGFVPATIGGTWKLLQDGTEPTTRADVDPAAGNAATPRIVDLLAGLYERDGQPPAYPVDDADRRAVIDADYTVDGHGHDLAQHLTVAPGTFTVDGAVFADTDPTVVLGNDEMTLLRALNIDTDEPDVLLGRALDGVGAVVDQLDAVDSLVGGETVPFLNRGVESVLREATGLRQRYNDFRSGLLPTDLGKLETGLETALGLGVTFRLRDLDGSGSVEPALIAAIDGTRTEDADVPMSLIDASLPAIAGTEGEGKLHAALEAKLDLGLVVGLDPDPAAAPPRLLDSSRVSVTAEVTEQPAGSVQLGVHLGPFSAQLGDATNHTGRIAVGVRFALARTGAPLPGDPAETPLALDDFFDSDFTADATSPAAGGTYSCAAPGQAPVEGKFACAALPVLVDVGSGPALPSGAPANAPTADDYLTVSYDDLSAAPDVSAPSALASILDSASFSFDSFGEGLQSISKVLGLAIDASKAGGDLPVVGKDLTKLANGLVEVKAFLDNPQIPGLPDADVNAAVYGAGGIREVLAQKFIAAGVLRDSEYQAVGTIPGDADTVPSATDIRVVAICNDGGVEALCDGTEQLTFLVDLRFELELGQGARALTGGCPVGDAAACPGVSTIPLELGLPGLPVSLTGSVTASAGWTVELGFGVSRNDGFYLLDNPVPGTGVADPETGGLEEIRVNVGANLTAGEPIAGRIGFIGMEAVDNSTAPSAPSGARLSAQLGLETSGCQNLDVTTYGSGVAGTHCTSVIPISSFLSGDIGDLLTEPRIEGGINLDLHIDTGIATGGNVNTTLPTFELDFGLVWAFDGSGAGDLELELRDIGVAPGQMFTKLFGEVLRTLDPILAPTKPVREFLFSPIPVISDLSEYFGGDPVTMVTLAKALGVVDVSLLEDIDQLFDFLEMIEGLADGSPFPLVDKLELSPETARGAPLTQDQALTAVKGSAAMTGDPEAAVGTALGGSSDDFDKLRQKSAPSESDFSFPMFDDPTCLVGLLLGKDCAVVEWRPDALAVHMEYTQSFGPFFGVLYITIGGALDAKAQVGGGVSTRGIRMLAESIIGGEVDSPLDAATKAGSAFLQSLYLTDLDAEGKDVAEFEISGTITAGAKLDIFIAEAGVKGGITATFGLNLNDTPEADGRMHIDEIVAKFKTPICLFDIEGKLIAFLEVYAEFGPCPFCYSDSWRLAEVTLFEFSSSCANQTPVLAAEEGGWVVLNVGSRAVDRGAFMDVENESFTVHQLSETPQAGVYEFSISAFGYTETRKGAGVRIIDALGGNDSFLFNGSGAGAKPGDLNPESSDPPDDGEWAFSAPVDAKTLGIGDDRIITGAGDDTVNGGDGADTINVGDGTNTASGDADDGTGTGRDTVTGGEGVDTLRGGGDNDTVDGGLGGDTLRGDAGNDTLRGGKDKLSVPPGVTPPSGKPNQFDTADLIVGGPGADTVLGGAGGDRLFGDDTPDATPWDDPVDAEGAAAPGTDGVDRVEGEAGADVIFGGGAADELFGGFRLVASGVDTDADRIQGGDGADQVFGSSGADLLYGGRGGDALAGEAGADEVHGQSDDDPAVGGGADGDKLWGGPGADTITGDAGDDELVGDGDGADGSTMGGDTAAGGDGADLVLGDNGTIDGGPGARVAHPSETAGAGDPRLAGDGGADRIYGEGGADFAYGGAGPDLVHGNGGGDQLNGETDDDEVWGDADADFGFGGPGDDVVFGNAGGDQLHGQEGIDLIIGGHDDLTGADVGDTMYGGPDDDRAFGDDVDIDIEGTLDALDDVTITPSADSSTYGPDTGDGGTGSDEFHGQDAVDTLYGAEDYDQLFGELDGDVLVGGAGPDDIVGDRGVMSPAARAVEPPDGGWDPRTPNGSPDVDIVLVAPATGGGDLIWGDFDTVDAPWSTGGDDRAFGGNAADTLRGGAHDDHLEGNGGQDRIFGFNEDSDHPSDGADDLIGGSSPVNPQADPDGANLAPDEGEIEMQGNGEDDVMTGDNAVLTREPDPDDPDAWRTDPVTGGVFREVELLDTEKSGASLDTVSGGDYMLGNDENDRMFGEGGNDLVQGNAHDDLVEGDQDGDWLEGNDDEDDLIGGSSFPDQPDSGDVLWGGGGADVATGDNACIVRDVPGVEFDPSSCPALDTPAPAEFHYVTSQLGVETRRGLVIHDLDGPVASEFGRDIVNGGSGVDAEFGQDGNDFLFGDGGADFQHGNGGADVVVGDRPFDLYGGITLPPEVGGVLPAIVSPPAGLPGTPSVGADLVGPPEADGQDDQFGGSNLSGHRDSGDWLFGDGEADFQLGDNGELNRTVEGEGSDAAYAVYEERYPDNEPPADGSAVIERDVTRYDVGAPAGAGVWGADLIFGGNGTNPLISAGAGDGDDSQWGQDGDDRLFGEDGDDDQFGELGADTMWGGDGEDAMVGDRGGVQTRFVEADGGDADDPDILTHTSQGPPGINLGGPDSGAQDAVLHPFEAHSLYRGTSLTHDRDGSVLVSNGHEAGGADRMRGGPGHDSMHGGEGADLMNGDSGGDYAYGDDGADVMWGGRGNPAIATPDLPGRNAPGANGEWIDVLFGGFGANATEAGADIIDYQPRPGVDPAVWGTMVAAYADTAPENTGAETRQHHHGTDWQYGGWDRDVLQADVSANGPNDGDKLLDWGGAYNLYTACNSAYGGWNDVRKIDPNNLLGLEKLAYVTGARADFDGAPTLGDVQASGGSAYREAAIVYTKDLKNNTGKAFSGTPGHFEDFICTSD
ncbi:Ca2+-binding RTX toxin-like protein [Agromyces cerinus]|uniref:calcium-binding protein n=1 Tax=Agromyces cerinus TaxID=33878 RepID=UPI00195BA450|nr:calcium-binding protein [Agromyces cerinus]MBM7831219.1 Ca2+-binding RTX toxin-like protein [Agromyces cerinus]